MRNRTEPAGPNRTEPFISGTGRNRTRNRIKPNRNEPRRVRKTQAEPCRTGKKYISEPNRTQPINDRKVWNRNESNRTVSFLPVYIYIYIYTYIYIYMYMYMCVYILQHAAKYVKSVSCPSGLGVLSGFWQSLIYIYMYTLVLYIYIYIRTYIYIYMCYIYVYIYIYMYVDM